MASSLEAQRRLIFLAEASKVLMSASTYGAAVTSLARLTVPVLADYCVIYRVERESHRLLRVAQAHCEPEIEKQLGALLADSLYFSTTSPIGEVAHSGEPQLYESVTDAATLLFQEESLQPRSALVLPLKTRGNTLGVAALGMKSSGRAYGKADLAFCEEIASRASLVIDNAQQLARAQESNRLKEEFLATLSHELRTPLTAIVGYARLLIGRRLDEDASFQAIQSIHRNAQLQSQLISDLLDISRIATGKLNLEMRPVDLHSIVECTLDAVRLAAEAKNHKLEYSGDDLAGQVSGDPDRLQQIVSNLVSNAIKFTPPGGNIEVRLQSAGSHAVISVCDNGVGVNPDFLPHMFEKFRQADNSDSRQNGGLGLGLAIVRSLVELHGGTVQVQSAGLGSGSTFTVRLPLQSIALRRAG